MSANSKKRILITQDKTETKYLAKKINGSGMQAVCTPLETYFPVREVLDPEQLTEELDNADHIVFGSVSSCTIFHGRIWAGGDA